MEFVRIKADKNSFSKRRLVCGVGINDADYLVTSTINEKRIMCPYYAKWLGILLRSRKPARQIFKTDYN